MREFHYCFLLFLLLASFFGVTRMEHDSSRFERNSGKTRFKKDVISKFELIHNKLVEVARFANGLALSESLAQGNISFGRMVTGLMVAGQFPFELDRIQLLADSPHTGIDKIVSQLGSFESFLEGKTKFNVSDFLIEELIESLIYGQEIIKMKQQSAAMQKLMETLQKDAESLKNVANLILGANLDVSIEASSVLGSLPETIRSYPILMKEKDQILNSLTDAFDYLKLLNNETLTTQLLGSFSDFIDATDKVRNASMDLSTFFSTSVSLQKAIIEITNSTNSSTLKEDVIKDCSKVMMLLSFSNDSIDHLEKLANQSEILSIFQMTLEQISQTGHSNEIKKIDYILASTLHSTTKELELVSDFMKQMKPAAEIVEWAKSVSSSVRTKRSPSNKPGNKQKFLERLKLLSAFNGTKSLINAASLSNLENLGKNENIELVHFEEKISQQLKSVELWVDQVGSAHIVDDAIRSILSMMKNKKNFLKLESQQKKLNKLTDDIGQLGNVHHAEIGYRKFLKLLNWLRKIANWKENIRKIKGEKETNRKNEQGLILHHISEVIAFFKQFTKIINSTVPSDTQLSEVSKITNLQLKLESLTFLVGYYNNAATYKQFIEGAARSYGTDIKDALISEIIWRNFTKTEMTTDEENGDVTKSFELINGYNTSLDTIETNQKFLDEINKDTKVLEGLCKAAEAMSNEVIVSYEKGLKAMRDYKWTLPTPSSLVPTNLSQLIFPNQSNVSTIESLTKNLRVLFDLMKESNSSEEIRILLREMISDKKLPDVAKSFITVYEAWLDGAENMEILSYEIGLSSMNFLYEIGKIGKKIANLHNWLKSVPENPKNARVKRSFVDLRKSIAGLPQENKLKKLIHLVEKAQDSKTSEAVKQLGKDLETLAASFGIVIESKSSPVIVTTQQSLTTTALHTSTSHSNDPNLTRSQAAVIYNSTPKDNSDEFSLIWKLVIVVSCIFGAGFIICSAVCAFWIIKKKMATSQPQYINRYIYRIQKSGEKSSKQHSTKKLKKVKVKAKSKEDEDRDDETGGNTETTGGASGVGNVTGAENTTIATNNKTETFADTTTTENDNMKNGNEEETHDFVNIGIFKPNAPGERIKKSPKNDAPSLKKNENRTVLDIWKLEKYEETNEKAPFFQILPDEIDMLTIAVTIAEGKYVTETVFSKWDNKGIVEHEIRVLFAEKCIRTVVSQQKQQGVLTVVKRTIYHLKKTVSFNAYIEWITAMFRQKAMRIKKLVVNRSTESHSWSMKLLEIEQFRETEDYELVNFEENMLVDFISGATRIVNLKIVNTPLRMEFFDLEMLLRTKCLEFIKCDTAVQNDAIMRICENVQFVNFKSRAYFVTEDLIAVLIQSFLHGNLTLRFFAFSPEKVAYYRILVDIPKRFQMEKWTDRKQFYEKITNSKWQSPYAETFQLDGVGLRTLTLFKFREVIAMSFNDWTTDEKIALKLPFDDNEFYKRVVS